LHGLSFFWDAIVSLRERESIEIGTGLETCASEEELETCASEAGFHCKKIDH